MKAIKEFIRLNKKMFYVLCGVVGVFVLILIILLIVKLVNGTKISYEQLQDKMVIAAENYYDDNTETLPKNEGDEISISVDTLVEKGYLKSLDKLVDASCSGSVVVKKNGEQYMYYPSLDCGSDYKTRTLGSIITDQSNIVETGDGLYKTEDGYVFRGEYVNNYVTFADSTWRIISIDNNGNIRMVKEKREEDSYTWDDRYNVEADDDLGINDFSKSRIYEQLKNLYNNEIQNEYKKHLLQQNICVDKKNDDSSLMSSSCNSYLNSYLGLIYPSEYYKASIDGNCNNYDSNSCINYNYMYNFIDNSWTSISYVGNTYQSYFINGYVDHSNDCMSRFVNLVVVISDKELYSSGNGSSENPFVVK